MGTERVIQDGKGNIKVVEAGPPGPPGRKGDPGDVTTIPVRHGLAVISGTNVTIDEVTYQKFELDGVGNAEFALAMFDSSLSHNLLMVSPANHPDEFSQSFRVFTSGLWPDDLQVFFDLSLPEYDLGIISGQSIYDGLSSGDLIVIDILPVPGYFFGAPEGVYVWNPQAQEFFDGRRGAWTIPTEGVTEDGRAEVSLQQGPTTGRQVLGYDAAGVVNLYCLIPPKRLQSFYLRLENADDLEIITISVPQTGSSDPNDDYELPFPAVADIEPGFKLVQVLPWPDPASPYKILGVTG